MDIELLENTLNRKKLLLTVLSDDLSAHELSREINVLEKTIAKCKQLEDSFLNSII